MNDMKGSRGIFDRINKFYRIGKAGEIGMRRSRIAGLVPFVP